MHTPEQEKAISEYNNAVDKDVRSFVEDVIKGNDRLNYITVAFLSKEASQQIKEKTQKQVEGSMNEAVAHYGCQCLFINSEGIRVLTMLYVKSFTFLVIIKSAPSLPAVTACNASSKSGQYIDAASVVSGKGRFTITLEGEIDKEALSVLIREVANVQ